MMGSRLIPLIERMRRRATDHKQAAAASYGPCVGECEGSCSCVEVGGLPATQTVDLGSGAQAIIPPSGTVQERAELSPLQWLILGILFLLIVRGVIK